MPDFSTLVLATRDTATIALPACEAGEIYDTLLEAYAGAGQAIEVDFRALVRNVGSTERATHGLHPYPAKVLRHIPALFAAAPQLSKPGDVIFDPFCGSGTVLVEAQVTQRGGLGWDVNPLACVMSRVKTTPIRPQRLIDAKRRILERSGSVNPAAMPQRLDYWFHPKALADLAALRAAISQVRDPQVRDFFGVCLSVTARTASLADPRIAVPVRLKVDQYPHDHWLHERTAKRLRRLKSIDVIDLFSQVSSTNIGRIKRIPDEAPSVTVAERSARELVPGAVPDKMRPTCVITSPPYLGAQKYIRASSIGLLASGLAEETELGALQEMSIGREHFRQRDYTNPMPSGVDEADRVIDECAATNPLRAHLASTYLREMRTVLAGLAGVLPQSAAFVLVAGPNRLCGRAFPTPSFLLSIARSVGFSVELSLLDTIRSRGLMTRRNHSAALINQETVTVLRRTGR